MTDKNILLVNIILSTDSDCLTVYNGNEFITDLEIYVNGYCTTMDEVDVIVRRFLEYLKSVSYKEYDQREYTHKSMLYVQEEAIKYISDKYHKQLKEYEFGETIAYERIGGNQYFEFSLSLVEPATLQLPDYETL